MQDRLHVRTFILMLACACSVVVFAQAPPEGPTPTGARDLFVTVGKSVIIDSPVNVERVSVADPEMAEAVAATPREILINGRAAGETSLIIWQEGGNRLLFDLHVRANLVLREERVESIRAQLAQEFPDQPIDVSVEGQDVFLRGTVEDLVMANRAVAIVSRLGEPVNLLHVNVPPVEAQILLKVRFANVDRSTSRQLGMNLVSTGALNTLGRIGTGAIPAPDAPTGGSDTLSITDALNIFLFRPDLDLATTIRALQARNLLEVLAEPNVLTINGKQASFLSGGEFPYPNLQGGGGGLGQVTVAFREFGVRINFLPRITPRNTIRMQVTPEVSSLDFANGLVFQGFNIPALATRRVDTEIELESGQSFAIAGLLDNRVIQNMTKIPGLGDIPFFGRLFRAYDLSKNNSELLVMVTPEIVRPIPADIAEPEIEFPEPVLEGTRPDPPRTPGMEETGPVPVTPPEEVIPIEQLIESMAQQDLEIQTAPSPTPMVEFIPATVAPVQAVPQSAPAPAQQAPAAGGQSGGTPR